MMNTVHVRRQTGVVKERAVETCKYAEAVRSFGGQWRALSEPPTAAVSPSAEKGGIALYKVQPSLQVNTGLGETWRDLVLGGMAMAAADGGGCRA